ncbi:ADP-ribosylglycohydrolase family protein [Actinokineospora iranica]|uniref:ADP-ribosylglycohydrolase n=1 Tax=Actinokineospora iranica TaxID=1271860 RepID=A0A1G6R008_9PSEU|nr:ADP-ribosylglycohydrolase family protein [Actinokineospora iranica]SDC98000.1 ADP-ribosylglycohydrolase [Actinokineospora iranica]
MTVTDPNLTDPNLTDPNLTDADLAVLARLLRLQQAADARPIPPGPAKTLRVEVHIGADAAGRWFVTRNPVAPADPDSLRPVVARVDPRRWRGCVLAGAVADALGAPIEGKPLDQIRGLAGPAGITAMIPAYNGVGRITDDTQMTLFTLDALIRAHAQQRREGRSDVGYALQMAYQRWLHTQGVPWAKARGPRDTAETPDGWLIGVPGLFKRRAPGATCFFTLQEYGATGRAGTLAAPVNDSKGCGGVMRAAPAALWSDDPAVVFDVAAMSAAVTHGHPSGYLSAGALAMLVHGLLRGVPLRPALDAVRAHLARWERHEETSAALDAAIALAASGPPTPERVETLGTGAVGESALAIAVYAALAADNLNAALLLSVNHSGDSDSTGAVCGNIVGALYGEDAIDQGWLSQLELRDVIERLANDALAEFGPTPPNNGEWVFRYPAAKPAV